MLQSQYIKCYRVRDFRIRDSNLKSQRFKFYYTFCLQSHGSEIHISRVRDSYLKSQRFISQESEIHISRDWDSYPKSQRFISQESELHTSRAWDPNKYSTCKHHWGKKRIYYYYLPSTKCFAVGIILFLWVLLRYRLYVHVYLY